MSSRPRADSPEEESVKKGLSKSCVRVRSKRMSQLSTCLHVLFLHGICQFGDTRGLAADVVLKKRKLELFTRGKDPCARDWSNGPKLFKGTPKRSLNFVLWAWLENIFSPNTYQFLLTTHRFLQRSTLKGTGMALTAGNFRFKHTKRYQSTGFNPLKVQSNLH